jgi:hypothetical protein
MNRSKFTLFAASFFFSALACACSVQEEKRKARANGARAVLASTHAHFGMEAATICTKMPTAETPIVPPLENDCSQGCRCPSASAENSRGNDIYDCDQWKAPEWRLLHFAGRVTEKGTPPEKVYFHHKARWQRNEEGCRLEFTLFGDLDGDGVHSTYASWVEATTDGQLADLPDVRPLWE